MARAGQAEASSHATPLGALCQLGAQALGHLRLLSQVQLGAIRDVGTAGADLPSRATPLAPMPSSPLACREPYYPKTVKLYRRVCFPLVSHFFLRNWAATLWDCRSWAEEARRAAQLPEEGRQRSTSPKGLSGHTWCRTFWSVVVVAGLRVQQLGSVSDAGAWQTSESAEGCFLSVLVGLLEASGMGV